MNKRPEMMNETYQLRITDAEEARPGIEARVEKPVDHDKQDHFTVLLRLSSASRILARTYKELGYG